MSNKKSEELGSASITKLIFQQAIPAAIGVLVMSIYMIVDTIFVGQWVGSIAIAAITIVMPISFLISSVGMSIGIGGASIISRALGAEKREHALFTFANQLILVVSLSVFFVLLGLIFEHEILLLFGGKGDILNVAEEYFQIILYGVPFLAFAMMSSQVVRSIGYPNVSMYAMLLPAFINIILDPIFIKTFNWGLAGAAWATTISYIISAIYTAYFLFIKNDALRISSKYLKLKAKIITEIASLGGVTLARQGVISVLSIVLNNALFHYGGELYISVYGIVSRVMMFSLFPVMGITQSILPIVGYNYGAKKYERVRSAVFKSIFYGTIASVLIYLNIIIFESPLVKVFTDDPFLLAHTPHALFIIFLATPSILVQLVGGAYFQAIGKARTALLITLSKQGFFLIPLISILPIYFGIEGIWYSFPIADILSVLLAFTFLSKDMRILASKASLNKN